MKIKVKNMSPETIEKIAKNPEAKIDINDPWWVIALKVVAYLIGLLLAGVGTTEAANIIFFQ